VGLTAFWGARAGFLGWVDADRSEAPCARSIFPRSFHHSGLLNEQAAQGHDLVEIVDKRAIFTVPVSTE
jgi:hypothetical protein